MSCIICNKIKDNINHEKCFELLYKKFNKYHRIYENINSYKDYDKNKLSIINNYINNEISKILDSLYYLIG